MTVVVEGVMEEKEKRREECACLRRETGSSGTRGVGGKVERGVGRVLCAKRGLWRATCGMQRERMGRPDGRRFMCVESSAGTRGEEREPGGQTRNGESADECIDTIHFK